MAATELKSYVEKYLLNPGASFAVDDEGNQDARPEVVGALADGEGADEELVSVSKLRARSAAIQPEKDPRYKGKKITRKDLAKDKDVDFDPELTKYFLVKGEDEDESEEGEDSTEEGDESVDNENSEDADDAEGTFGDTSVSEATGVRFVDDGDFSKFAEDFDNEDDSEHEEDDNEGESGEDFDEDKDDEIKDDDLNNEEGKGKEAIKRFRSEDQSEELKKGQAVKNQLAIYDSLFEGRIKMQKVVSSSNRFPQHDTYKLFLMQKDLNYTHNLIAAKSATRHLLTTLIDFQELLLKQNPETSHIITGKKSKFANSGGDEEITSSEEENESKDEKEESRQAQGVKRKMKLEECEEVLAKRHTAMIPFRDFTINKWYEKTKLLSSQSAGKKFSGFEVSALQQLKNILSNKQQLVRRTQFTGSTRGTTYEVLGRPPPSEAQQKQTDEYDPEIFDDTDFYTRCLEEVLKSKVAFSDNMIDVSRKWIEIQNLRRKSKKNVDRKASKGRKIRYEVMSKIQQYLAPSFPPLMDDAAVNTLFASLFGKSTQMLTTG